MKLSSVNTKKLKIRKGYLASVGAVAIFLAVIYVSFFNLNLTEESILNIEELKADSYQELKKKISGNNVKELMRSGQFENIEYCESLIENKNYPKRDNPFEKSF